MWYLLLLQASTDAAEPIQAFRPPKMQVADCDIPAKRQLILDGGQQESEALSAYKEQRQRALEDRLDALGLNPREQAALVDSVVRSEAFVASQRRNAAISNVILADLVSIANAKSPTQQCRTIVHMVDQSALTISNTEIQWQLFDSAIDAEVRKRQPQAK